ncbi:MAG TPA: hypothetical protein VE377_23900 [Candidatus Dormibacteraeota bacterium]|nr:hypothetical protein [Candidatus Dormibacteraeota bacterium]
MKGRSGAMSRVLTRAACGICVTLAASCLQAQVERAFPQPKAMVEKTLKTMQATMAGRLPALEGFANPGEHPLDRYRRGYYQIAAEVSVAPSGGSVVRATTKVTAWYSDPVASRSGYQLLKSNGRLEADLLDQLEEQLAKNSPEGVKSAASVSPTPSAENTKQTKASTSGSPLKFPDTKSTFPTSLSHDLAVPRMESPSAQPAPGKTDTALQEEAENLEKMLKSMAHPNNLVAVSKSGTPVVATPSLTAKPQFLASMHDEFELLDFNADWVHVRISGLSRGWIWRNSVEMPEGIPDTAGATASSLAPAADLFQVSREEVALFPGDWEPLRGKNVKIISVQKVDEAAKDAGSKDRLAYAKYLLEKNYTEIAKHPELQGVVMIFDSADGGMIAATVDTLQQWRAGRLTDSALWRKCFFDPPETFDSAASSGSR